MHEPAFALSRIFLTPAHFSFDTATPAHLHLNPQENAPNSAHALAPIVVAEPVMIFHYEVMVVNDSKVKLLTVTANDH